MSTNSLNSQPYITIIDHRKYSSLRWLLVIDLKVKSACDGEKIGR